jgi:WhiB family redox-sensing transcriptional regulator
VCLGADPEVFFVTARLDEARSICGPCPGKHECLARALDEPHGVWAGTTPEQRRELRGEPFPCLIDREGGWADHIHGMRMDSTLTRYWHRRTTP